MPLTMRDRPVTTVRATWVVAAALAGVCTFGTTPAQAAQPTTSDVEKLIKRANELRTAGKDQVALPLYQKAYEAAHTPRTAAQLGLCEMALNYWLAAESHLSESLAGHGDWIDRNRSTIEASLREVQGQIGELILSGSPAGAIVKVDGKEVGTLPLSPLRVSAGQLTVEVSAPGHKDHGERVTVVGGSQTRVTLHLAPESEAVAAADPHARIRPPAEQRGKPADSASWSTSKVAGVSAIIAGGLAIVGGGTLLLLDKDEACNTPSGGMCVKRKQTRVPGWALVGVGAAAVLVGAYVVYSSPSGEVALGASPSSIFVAGRF